MSQCYYCRHGAGTHHLDCPKLETVEWQRGRDDGRDGKQPLSDSPVYVLGWKVGEIALEEQQNGHDPRTV